MRLCKTTSRLWSFLLVMLLLIGSVPFSMTAGAASLNQQIADLEKKQAQIKSEIADLKKDISKQQELKAALQKQVNNTQSQIDLYNSQITELNQKIEQLEADKKAKEENLENSKETFKKRLRAMYMSGNTSELTLLLSADDFGDFLYKNELLRSVAEYDNQVIEQLKNDIIDIEKIETEVQEDKKEIDSMKASVSAKQKELNASLKQLNATIGELNEQKSDLEDENSEYAAAIKSLERQIAAAASNAQSNSKIVYSGAQFLWPCPGYYNITSQFRPPHRPTHNGIDIASSGIYGKPIVAAADGQVILAGNNGNGYGIYVMIDHGKKDGKSYVTLYGHCSSIIVSKGQMVKAGQTIGYVGSTGRSTGPHLHYEIRVNGNPNHPLNFYNKVG